MAYREKAAWIGFVTWLIGWTVYFIVLARTLAAGGSQGDLSSLSIICVSSGVLWVAWLQRRVSKRELEEADERERLVEIRSSEIAFRAVLILVGVAAFAALACDNALKGVSLSEPGYSIFHALLLLVVLSGLVRFAAQIVLFRRGGV